MNTVYHSSIHAYSVHLNAPEYGPYNALLLPCFMPLKEALLQSQSSKAQVGWPYAARSPVLPAQNQRLVMRGACQWQQVAQ